MSKSLNILAVNWRDPLHSEAGGAEKHLDQVLSYLSKNHNIVLISTRTSKKKETFYHNGYKVCRIGHPFFFDYTFRLFWKRILSMEKFDLIIDDISKIPMGLPTYIKNIPILAFFHHVHADSLFRAVSSPIVASYLYFMEKIRLKCYKNTPMITVSKSSYKELSKLSQSKEIYIVPNGVDDFLLDTPIFHSKTPFQLCILSRLVATKRIDLSLKVFKKIHEAYPQAILKIAGAGREEKKIKQYAKKIGVERAIEFLLHVTEEEKKILLRFSEGMIITSEKEGWGIAAMEASACGTPVFAFRVPGILDSVIPGINGYLSDFEAIHELATLIKSYLAQPTKEKEKIQHSAIILAKQYKWQTIAKKIEYIIYDILNL